MCTLEYSYPTSAILLWMTKKQTGKIISQYTKEHEWYNGVFKEASEKKIGNMI